MALTSRQIPTALLQAISGVPMIQDKVALISAQLRFERWIGSCADVVIPALTSAVASPKTEMGLLMSISVQEKMLKNSHLSKL
jgi:predicted anti-sigma-YlaC factor YlaD